MTNTDNLVLEVRPDQLVAYGKLLVAFYDDFKNKKIDEEGKIVILNTKETDKDGKVVIVKSKPTLYIHIQNSDDKYSVTKRAASMQRNQAGNRAEEKRLFAKAYVKYLEIKNNGGLVDHEKEALKAKVAELEAKAKVAKSAPVVPVENEKSVAELKAELDLLKIDYKGNASREVLLELLAGK